jgi:D-lactate dehydrogenase (cytochrome)
VQQLSERMVERAIRMGGTCTGEHGIGLGKKKYLELEFGQNGVELMRTLKSALDPHHLMNPGKLVPASGRLRNNGGAGFKPVAEEESSP